MQFRIELYQLPNGKKPFQIWFEKLKDKTSKDQILQRLDRILEDGNFGNFKHLRKDLFELKFQNGTRIYYTKIGNQIVLLLSAGTKSKQVEDIKKAKEYLDNYHENK